MISADGLLLTDYHILGSIDFDKTRGIYAMTWDGMVWPVEGVLFADKQSDVAVVQLEGNGHVFHAAPLADTAPAPTDPVRVVSHPSSQFYSPAETQWTSSPGRIPYCSAMTSGTVTWSLLVTLDMSLL